MQLLKNFGPAFEELKRRLVLGSDLVKYYYKITYKETWKYRKGLQIRPYQAYL